MTEYINRQAALDLLWKDGRITTSGIKAIPAADVAPVVHGQWIGEEIDIETGDIFATLQECSVCHRVRQVDSYCSHCGAKMDKEVTNA